MNSRLILAGAFGLLAAAGWRLAPQGKQEHVLDAKLHHLGNDATPDWSEAAKEPEGTRLDLRFRATRNAREWTLRIEQRSINEAWRLKLNGAEIAQMQRVDRRVTRYYPVPANALIDGDNELSIVPDVPSDDVVIGNLRLYECTLRELYDLQPVEVRVTDLDTHKPSPARVTFVDASGNLAPLYYAETATTAVRDGVVYTCNGVARFELPPGEYRSFATRGAEWGLSEATVTVAKGAPTVVEHAFRREVDTTGFIACDTHIHTLTFSGHGDSSVDERMVTLAGEGVELAVATDHNHNTDYRPYQQKLELGSYFTPVVGNEVTTKVGHFNGFPLDPKAEVPPHELEDYVQIVDGMRAKGAKVVILNHPRWPDHEKGPFGVHHLDHFTGARSPELKLTVDATEMVNSTTEESDPMLLFSDWFALLNRGEHISAVGSSDSHTVGEPVGQGRTYIPSQTDDPSKIDVDACCEAIKQGRTSIGMGIFATVLVDGRWTTGDVVNMRDRAESDVKLRVRAPSWIRPRKATVFLNGAAVDEREIETKKGTPTDVTLEFELEWYPMLDKQSGLRVGADHSDETTSDNWLVCVVTGDGVEAPYWKTTNPYTLAATNPVFLDFDGDGYQSPRETAAKLLGGHGDPGVLYRVLPRCDDVVAMQAVDLALEKWRTAGRSEDDIKHDLAFLPGDRWTTKQVLREFIASR